MQCAGWSFLFFTLRRQPEQQRCELRGVLLELQQLFGQHELEHRRAQFCNKMIYSAYCIPRCGENSTAPLGW